MFFEQLESRQLLAPVAWNVDSDGFWDVGSNWSTGVAPNVNDDVTIDRPGGTFKVKLRDGFGGQNVRTLAMSSDETLEIAGAGLYVDQTSTVAGTITLDNAYWQPGNVVTVSGTMTWNSGTVTGNTTVIGASGSLNIASAGAKTLNGNGLSIFGTVHHTGTGQLDANARITVNAGGVYQLETDATIGAGGRFVNSGTLRKTAGSGEALLSKPFDNVGGIVESNSGVLSFSNGGDWTNGTLNASVGAAVNLAGGNFNLSGAYSGNGAGKIFLNTSLFTQVPSTTLNFPAGLFDWIGGSIFAHSSRPLINLGTVSLAGAGTKNLHGPFQNSGTVILKDNGNFDLVGSPASLENLVGGLFDIQSDADSNFGDINNAGTLRKSGGNGKTILGSRVNNLGGIIDVQVGKLTLAGANAASTGGTFNVAAAAILDLTGGAAPVGYGGTYTGSGDGRIEVNDGGLNGSGGVFNFPAGMFHQTGGHLYGGGAANPFTNAGEMTVSGSGDKRIGGTWNNTGTILHAEGNFLFDNGTNFLNSGLYDFQGDGQTFAFSHVGGGNHSTASSGIIRKSAGTGVSTIGDGTSNFRFLEGTVEVLSGTLKLDRNGGDASTGATFNVAAGASVDWVSAGSYTGVYAGSGEGQVHISGDWLPVDAGAIWNFVPGMLDFAGGNISTTPHGYSDLTNRGEVTFVGPDARNIARNFFNEGKIIHTGSGGLTLSSGRLTNYGTYEVQSDVTFSLGTFDNKGTLTKTAGSGTFLLDTVNMAFNNDRGRIEVHSGKIDFAASGSWNEATFETAPGTSIVLSGNVKGWNGSFTGIGAGIVEVTSAALNGESTVHLNFPEGMFQMSGGQLLGDIANDGFLHFTMSDLSSVFARALITNNGTIVHSGEGPLVLNANSRFVNNGLYDLQSDADLVVPGDASVGTVQFVNSGTLRKSNGLGTSAFRHDGSSKSLRLDNLGIVEVRAGTLSFNDPIAQTTGTTLNAGTWIVGPFSTLTIPPASNIAINKANVTLDGPSSVFTNFSALNNNQGILSLLNGRDLATGALANSGSITLGRGSQLTVTGALTQTGHNQLTFQIGGTPVSGQFGSLTTTTAANLQGAIRVQLVDGFGPNQSDAYQLAGYASRTGTNPVIAGLEPFFSASLTGTAFTVTATDSAADLAVTAFVAPLTGTPGQNVTVNYQVANQSLNAIAGDWTDSIFLSRDITLSADDQLLGRVPHIGGLVPLGVYPGSLTAPLPGVEAGNFFILVSADSSRDVPDTIRANNVRASTNQIAVDISALAFGVTTGGTIANNQDIYYKLDVPAGGDVILTGNFAAMNEAEFFVRYQDVPTRSSFDFVASNLLELSRKITLASPQAGTYYILVHGREGAGAGTAYSLRADHIDYALASVAPSRGSNLGSITTTIRGTGFTPGSVVELLSQVGSVERTATVRFQDANTLYATFNLLGVTAGAYDVRVTNVGHAATLDDGITVTTGLAGRLEYNINAPLRLREGRESTAYVEYRNAGETDIVAPLLFLFADNAQLRLAENPEYRGSNLEILGINQNGPAGVLPPGYVGRLPIKFLPTNDTNFNLQIMESDEAINWSFIKPALKPPAMPQDAWDAVFANYVAQLGSSGASLHAALLEDATYFSELGQPTADVERLKHFEMLKASDFGGIVNRYTLGAFGRGNPQPFETKAVVNAAGHVTIVSGSSFRFFKKLSNGSYAGSDGEMATLTRDASNGTYRLRETNGLVTGFRSDGKFDYLQDPNGNKATATYSGARVTALTDNFGDAISFAYNAQGRISQSTDAVGRIVTYVYDAGGEHLLSATSGDDVTEFTYVTGQGASREHAIASMHMMESGGIFFEYDSFGRLTKQTLEGNNAPLTFTYESGATVVVTDVFGNSTRVSRSDNGQIARRIDPLGNVESFQFDADGRVTGAVGALGTRISASYDAIGNFTQIVNPAGQATDINFDAILSRLQTFRDAEGNTVGYGYDARGNLIRITSFDASKTEYVHSGVGNVVEVTNRRGEITRLDYSSKNLLIRKRLPDGSIVTYTYDSHRNLTSVTDVRGTTSYEYDEDKLIKITQPNGRFVEYAYDAAGRRSRMETETGFALNYAYDVIGRLASVRDGLNAPIATYTYDAGDRLSREDFANGTFRTYQYDTRGDIVKLTLRKTDNTVLSEIDYTYDALGRRVTETAAAGTTTFGYDAAGQLTKVALPGGRVIEYAYDFAGNRISATDNGVVFPYGVNDLNQYTSVGAATYTYDADGNLKTKTDVTGTTTYSYDSENRLISSVSLSGTTTYEYDPLGNLVAQVKDGVRSEFSIDPFGYGDIVAEYDGGGALQANNVHGLGLVSRINSGGAGRYYSFDAAGNTVRLTDGSGAVSGSYSYLPFGEVLSETGGAGNPATFGGQFGVRDAGDGTYFMRARSYDPALGRFMQQDPINISAGDTNFYRYVGNNPVSYVDPTGLECVTTTTTKTQTNNIVKAGETTETGVKVVGAVVVAGGGVALGTGIATAAAGIGADVLAASTVGLVASVGGLVVAGTMFAAGTAYIISVPFTWAIDSYFCDPEVPNPFSDDVNTNECLINHLLAKHAAPWTPAETAQAALECRDEKFPGTTSRSTAVRSADPNDISGPAGFGANHYVANDNLMPYVIHFENMASATAPAQEVIVTQQLDSDLDLATFELQSFGYGNLSIDIPAGLSYYKNRIDAAASLGLWVDFEAGVNLSTGLATWKFTSLDPATGDLTEDALAGFLPPNVTAPLGEGFVSYLIRPKAALVSGTRIDAEARIVFDTNAPIDTPPIFNTIDAGNPTSTVTVLAANTYMPVGLNVSWSGADDAMGSGIGSYSIFASQDGGPFTLWLGTTTATSGVYPGPRNHAYAFYAVAFDNVGHGELSSSTAEASTFYFGPAWQNPVNVLEVDDGVGIVPHDVLLIVNELNVRTISAANGALPAVPPTPGYQTPHWDVNGDNFVTAIDALLVVNFLNLPLIPPPGPEGEAAQSSLAVATEFSASPLVLESSVHEPAHDRVFAELAQAGSGDARVSWMLEESTFQHFERSPFAESSSSASGLERARSEETELPWSVRLRKSRRATES
ncbi:MAG: RHS repeat-associated core domain-containing protein [Pirellulaceae bacterium]